MGNLRFKFRCWNAHGKVMHHWAELVEKNKIHLLAEQKPSYKIMQYIGLKDENGVEIYEGDIVSDHVGIGEVKYSEDKASFKVEYNDGFAKWFLDYNLRGERKSIEVIGNIHENHELLKENTYE